MFQREISIICTGRCTKQRRIKTSAKGQKQATAAIAAPCYSKSLAAAISCLSEGKGDIAVFDHVLDLSSHRQAEENKPVHHQNRPEYRDVEDLRPAAQESNRDGSGRGMPELELRESADKRAEFVIVLRGKGGTVF